MARSKCKVCDGLRGAPLEVDGKICHNSYHSVQSIPLDPDAKHLMLECGPHCGVKDKMEAHCDCVDCHNGKREKLKLPQFRSLDGKSVQGINRPE